MKKSSFFSAIALVASGRLFLSCYSINVIIHYKDLFDFVNG
jgi:hypothetical protein